ncbi:hypothetical protein HDU76_007955, partial [Blyttiomyces sp. JEL0837]
MPPKKGSGGSKRPSATSKEPAAKPKTKQTSAAAASAAAGKVQKASTSSSAKLASSAALSARKSTGGAQKKLASAVSSKGKSKEETVVAKGRTRKLISDSSDDDDDKKDDDEEEEEEQEEEQEEDDDDDDNDDDDQEKGRRMEVDLQQQEASDDEMEDVVETVKAYIYPFIDFKRGDVMKVLALPPQPQHLPFDHLDPHDKPFYLARGKEKRSATPSAINNYYHSFEIQKFDQDTHKPLVSSGKKAEVEKKSSCLYCYMKFCKEHPDPPTKASTRDEVYQYYNALMATCPGGDKSGGSSTPKWNHIFREHTEWAKSHFESGVLSRDSATKKQLETYDVAVKKGVRSRQELDDGEGAVEKKQASLVVGDDGKLVMSKKGKETVGGVGSVNLFNMHVETFRTWLMKIIIIEGRSFESVESPHLQQWAREIAQASGSVIPNNYFPSVTTFKRDMEHLYCCYVLFWKFVIEKLDSKLSFQIDAYTTPSWNYKAFLGIIASFINADWELKMFVMDLLHIPDQHTAEYLGQMFFKSIYGRFGVKSRKVLAITSDNASNNDDRFFDALRDKFNVVEGKHPSNLQFENARIRCFAHILNLAVQGMLQSLNMAPGTRPSASTNPPNLNRANTSNPSTPASASPGVGAIPSVPTASGAASGSNVGASSSTADSSAQQASSSSVNMDVSGGGESGDGNEKEEDVNDSNSDGESEWSDADDNFVVEIPRLTPADEGAVSETHAKITALAKGVILDDVSKTEDVGNIVNKLRAFIKKIKSSPKLAEELLKIQQQSPFKENPLFKTPLKVILDVKTRWNSTHAMIERALILKP